MTDCPKHVWSEPFQQRLLWWRDCENCSALIRIPDPRVSVPSAAATEESPSPEQREQWTAEINRAMQASPPDGKIRRE